MEGRAHPLGIGGKPLKEIDASTVSHSVLRREQEIRGQAWRCLVVSDLLVTRQGAGGGEVGVQRLGISL